jgi:hypothetical protein
MVWEIQFHAAFEAARSGSIGSSSQNGSQIFQPSGKPKGYEEEAE